MQNLLPLLLLVLCLPWVSHARPKIRNFHLSFAGSGFSHYYVTFDATHKYSTAQVRFGVALSHLNLTSDDCVTEFYDEACGHIFHCKVDFRQAGANSVYYQAGAAKEDLWSPVFQVRTRSMSTSGQGSHRVWVDGDLGIVDAAPTIAAFAKVYPTVDFALHPGDISYANSHAHSSTSYEQWYSHWFQLMSPGIASVPYMVAPGNHEASCSWWTCYLQTHNFTTFKERFRMPGRESGSDTPMWYSFDYGPVHYLSFSTETDYEGSPHDFASGNEPTQQLQWIEADLAAVNRTSTPWIVVYGHRPWYNNEPKQNHANGYPKQAQMVAMLRAFEPLFAKYRVDLHIAGHVHNYQRDYPARNGTLVQRSYSDAQAMVNMIVGGAGQRHGIERVNNNRTTSAPWYATGYGDGKPGYGILSVHNGSALTWEYYDSATMHVVDSVLITKNVNA